MIEWVQAIFLDPLSHDFMQRGMLACLMVGMVCAFFSCFLILKGWSLMGDAISHSVLPGIATAAIVGAPLAAGALIAGLFCAGTIGFVKQNCRVKEDAVMGILFSGMFALGLVMVGKIETDLHLMHILFGNVLGVMPDDLWQAGIAASVCSAILFLKRRDFMLYCFDPVQAQTAGLNGQFLHFSLLVLLAVTVVAALKAVGILLVIAMLIAPGAIGFLLTRQFDRMMAIAVGVAMLSCASGMIISYHTDVAPAPLIVVIQSAIFLLALTRAKSGVKA